MEKAESGQFSILSFLLQESQTTVKAVMEETGFSKATLTKYVTLLNDKALDSGLELNISLEDENLRLSIGAATKGRDIRSLFLENAVKYQILVYLLYHQQFLAHQLAQIRFCQNLTYPSKMDVGEVQSIRFAISISVFSARSGRVRNGKAICRNQRENRRLPV